MRVQLIQKVDNAHEDSIWSVGFVPSKGFITTGSVDENVLIWQETGTQEDITLRPIHTISGVSLGAVSLAFDSLGEYGAVNSLDSKVSVWNMEDFACVGEGIKLSPSECWGLAFVPRKKSSDPLLLAMAGGSAGVLRVWNVLENTVQKTFEIDSGSESDKGKQSKFILSVAVSPDGKYIAGSGMDGVVSIFDVESGMLKGQTNAHKKPVRQVTFTPDSKYLVSACDDMYIGVFEAATGKTIQVMSGHESWVLCVAVHPDGKVMASGGSDGKVKLWDMDTNKCIQTVSEHADQVWGVAWSEDGKRLASVADDRSVIVMAAM
jgi:WD repeat-containing protein 61